MSYRLLYGHFIVRFSHFVSIYFYYMDTNNDFPLNQESDMGLVQHEAQ